MSDASLELGKKWLEMHKAAGEARAAVDDMLFTLQRMENDHSDGAWYAKEAMWGHGVSAVSNLGGVACDVIGFENKLLAYYCSMSRDIAKTLNNAGHCADGSDTHCVGMTVSYGKAWARQLTKYGPRLIDSYPVLETPHISDSNRKGLGQAKASCKAAGVKGCDVIDTLADIKEIMELIEFSQQLDVNFTNNYHIGLTALQKVQAETARLETEANEAYAAFLVQREKDEERIKREQEEIAQAKKKYEEKEQAKRQQAEMEQAQQAAAMARQESAGAGASTELYGEGVEGSRLQPGSASGAGSEPSSPDRGSPAPGAGAGGKSFEATAWNYGDPVPGVEHPPEFDKTKKKIPCRLKDTNCLDPRYGGEDTPSQSEGPTSQNPWSQEIEQKIKSGLLSPEQIRQDIEQKVKGGITSSQKSRQQPCDENLGCPDDEPGPKGPSQNLLAKLDSDLDRIQNSQAGTAGGRLPGESLDASEGVSSFDKTAMLKSLRSGLSGYRQGRETFSPSGGSAGTLSGGNCPNMVPVPQELRRIAQRQGIEVSPDPTIDTMIRKAGSAEAAISGLRPHIQQLQEARAQWSPGQPGPLGSEDTRRYYELEIGYEQALVQAMECWQELSHAKNSLGAQHNSSGEQNCPLVCGNLICQYKCQ